jgi:magnesium transporter
VKTLERIDHAKIKELIGREEFFWLDVDSPADDEIDDLARLLDWNPLAVEDVKEFGQRPKLDDYRDHALMVFYGVHAPDGRLVETHIFISGDWIVTVRRCPCEHLHGRRKALDERPPRTEEDVVYAIVDALTDSYAPCVEDFDSEIERLEDAIVQRPDDHQIGEILRLRRRVGPLRRVANAQRDMFASVGDVIDRLPGLERDDARDQFRDVSDHLYRTADQLENQRDRLSGALQIYSSMSDNRLNKVTERLTLVATVFLPLTFTVGFFGQNFGWLVRNINSLSDFLLWGVLVGEIVPLILLYLLFRRAGWVKGPVVSAPLRKRIDED